VEPNKNKACAMQALYSYLNYLFVGLGGFGGWLGGLFVLFGPDGWNGTLLGQFGAGFGVGLDFLLIT
jgi:hypothetical protein